MPGEKIKSSKFMQRCVADVAASGKETGSAFAICTAQAQKAGYAETGSRKLTDKGKKREKQFAREKDMGDKKSAYLAATGRAEEANHAFTWRNVRGTVESLAGAAKLHKWADEGNSYVVFVGGDKHMKAGYVTLVNVGEESGSAEHKGHFMLRMGIPVDFKGVDSLSIPDTHEDMGESLKVFRALVAKAKGTFKVRDMERVADLVEYGRGTVEGRDVRGILRRLEEAEEDVVDVNGIAHEILRQLGGRKFLVMTGAKDLIHSPTLDADRKWPTLSMKMPQGKAKFVKIALAPSDTYTVQFMTRSGKVMAELDDIYAEQLKDVIEKHTGLALSL